MHKVVEASGRKKNSQGDTPPPLTPPRSKINTETESAEARRPVTSTYRLARNGGLRSGRFDYVR